MERTNELNLAHRNSALRGSGLGSDIEEFKEARAMFGQLDGQSRIVGQSHCEDEVIGQTTDDGEVTGD